MFLGSYVSLFLVSSLLEERLRELSRVGSKKLINLTHEVSTLESNHLLIIWRWRTGVEHMNFEEASPFNPWQEDI